MSAARKGKRKKLTRADMMRRWPTNVYLWTFRQMELWRLAR